MQHLNPIEYELLGRIAVPNRLANVFASEYEQMLLSYLPQEQLELTEHLLFLMKCLQDHSNAITDASGHEELAYSAFVEREDELLKKYGSRLKAYKSYQFHNYFRGDIILFLKDIYTVEAFNSLTGKEQRLEADEMDIFIGLSRNSLKAYHTNLLLNDAGKQQQIPSRVQSLNSSEQTSLTEEDEDLQISRTRQSLAIYYLLKSVGIEPRSTSCVSDVSRFVHLLTGIRFTSLQNSEVYKRLRHLTDQRKQRTVDLNFIRSYFENMGFSAAVSLIDQELEMNYRK